MKRRAPEIETRASAVSRDAAVPPALDAIGHSALAERWDGPRTLAAAEARYVAARDAWTKAMRAASSGRPADLASLALAQEAYEAAAAERERWLSGPRVTIAVENDGPHNGIDAVVGQELEWRRIRRPRVEGFFARIRRRLTGR